jgi:hypothetical protein
MTQNLYRAFFPSETRDFPGKRWVNILFRTLHLMGTAGLGGGYLYGAPEADWAPYLWLTLVSGGLLTFLEAWSNGVWLIQVRGLAVLSKIFILLLLSYLGGYELETIIAVIFISGIVSHAPGKIRYFSIFHGRQI